MPALDPAALDSAAIGLGQTGPAETGTVRDEGNNIYRVDGTQAALPTLLADAELAKLTALRSAPLSPKYKIETISPDGAVMLAQIENSYSFIPLHGAGQEADNFVPVKTEKALLAFTNFIWLDDDTVGFISSAPAEQTDRAYVGKSIDRRTGVMTEDEPRLAEAAAHFTADLLPVLLSPDGRKVLANDASNAKPIKLGAGVRAVLGDSGTDPLSAYAPDHTFGRLTPAWDALPATARFTVTEGAKLRVIDVATGVMHELVTIGPNPIIPDVSFSADGDKISITLLSSGDSLDRSFDGVRFPEYAYRDAIGILPPAENVFYQNSVIQVLDFPSGVVRTLRAADDDYVMFNGTSWSSDNQLLLVEVNTPGNAAGRPYPQFLGDFHSGGSLRFYDAELREVRRLERPEVDSPMKDARFFSADEVLIQTRYGLNGHPYYYNFRTEEFRNIADRPGTFFEVVPSPAASEIAFVYSSYTDPPEFGRMALDGTNFTRLTNLNAAARTAAQAKQYPVSFTLKNGETFEGILILPATVAFPPQNVPLVVWIAGGPTEPVVSNWQNTVEIPTTLLPNFDIAVLVTPLYGRYGFGAARLNALADNQNFGRIDIDAQAEIIEQVRALGWADKVGIAGCSYGGYFVTQSITRHPTTYDAAHTMCSIVDMVTEWSRGDGRLLPWLMGTTIYESPEEFVRVSPIYHTDQVQTPLLAFHGTKDFLPIAVMENFMLQITDNGVPTKLFKFQDGTHGFANLSPKTLSDAYELYGAQEQLLWFRKYLGVE
jgi:dipeptidyl aminopeptidase/acylaminoacyl peptidase